MSSKTEMNLVTLSSISANFPSVVCVNASRVASAISLSVIIFEVM